MGNCSHTAPEVATATEAGKEEAKGVAMVEVATVAEAKAVVTAAAARADSAVLMAGTVEVGATRKAGLAVVATAVARVALPAAVEMAALEERVVMAATEEVMAAVGKAVALVVALVVAERAVAAAALEVVERTEQRRPQTEDYGRRHRPSHYTSP